MIGTVEQVLDACTPEWYKSGHGLYGTRSRTKNSSYRHKNEDCINRI